MILFLQLLQLRIEDDRALAADSWGCSSDSCQLGLQLLQLMVITAAFIITALTADSSMLPALTAVNLRCSSYSLSGFEMFIASVNYQVGFE